MRFMRWFLRGLEWLVGDRLASFYWALMIVLGIATTGVGMYGWLVHEMVDGRWVDRDIRGLHLLDWLDAFQRGVKALLVSELYLHSPVVETPRSLLLARFSGAAFFVLLTTRLFLFALGGRLTNAFLWARRNHDIIIGDSSTIDHYLDASTNRSTHLVQKASRGYKRSAQLERTQNLSEDLEASAAAYARRIIIAEKNDEATWATARIAAAYLEDSDLEIIANISDPWLLERISRADPKARIRPFSYATGAARQIMMAHPPYLLARVYNAPAQHIIIVGFGNVGQALLREFFATSVSFKPAKMMATIVDPDANALGARFQAAHPGLSDYADIAFVQGDINADYPDMEAALNARIGQSEPCAVYVALDQEKQGHPLSVAVGVRDRAEREMWFRAPIFVRTLYGAGMLHYRQGVGRIGQGSLAAGEASAYLHDLSLAPFGGWAMALDGAGLLSSEFDEQAEHFHNAYLKAVGADKISDLSQRLPSQWPWGQLAEEYRVSNRRSAAHIRSKLDAAGFDLADWLEAGSPHGRSYLTYELPPASYALDLDDDAELDLLAELEHRRWCIDRSLNGWIYGPKRDDARRIHDKLSADRPRTDNEILTGRQNIKDTAKLIQQLTKG